jgi:curved DNA-binding protein CbpA
MIKKIEDLNFYELLEVSLTATSQDIHKAYERVRRVYEPNSIALYSLFTPEETAAIHQRIEEAYRTLVYEDNRKRYDAMLLSRERMPAPPPVPPSPAKYQASLAQSALPLHSENHYFDDLGLAPETSRPSAGPTPIHKSKPEEVSPVSTFIAEFSGHALKALREQRGVTLRALADTTKVSARYLELIEAENFDKLPARAYTRGFLSLYAKALGYEPERVIADYLKRYDAAVGKQKL